MSVDFKNEIISV